MKLNRLTILFCILVAFFFLSTGCQAGDFEAESPAGFWAGLWHGMISVVTFVISIFSSKVFVYAVHNTGAWYDFGFLLGVIGIWSGSIRVFGLKSSRRWDRMYAKVEKKLYEYFDGDGDEDENEEEPIILGKKFKAKLKRKIKEWVNEED